MAKPKKKKQSIREFVSEDSLKFQLYLLKLSNQLKRIEENTTEEITKKWNYDNNKKIDRFKNDMTKPQFSSAIAQAASLKNIAYAEQLPAPTDKEAVLKRFEEIRVIYISSLEKRIALNQRATQKQDIELLAYAKVIELVPNISKEKFGQMLLLMIKNLATMPSFSGYSDNWKTDFFGNAIEKTLLYLDNFDENLLSKRTGERSKAFAYVTQICFNAFVNIINIRKKEEAFLKDTISLESANLDGLKYYSNVTPEIKEDEPQHNEYSVKVKKISEIDAAIKKAIDHILSSNEILENNKANLSEIEYYEETTAEAEKDEDYDAYILDMKSKVLPELATSKIDTLRIIKPADTPLVDWKFPGNDILKGISLIVQEKRKKIKKIVKEEPTELIEINEMQEFDDEW